MYNKKECVVMLLAGGQGSRLYTLTEKTAKPADKPAAKAAPTIEKKGRKISYHKHTDTGKNHDKPVK